MNYAVFHVPLPRLFIITAQHEDCSDPKPLAGSVLPPESGCDAVRVSRAWPRHLEAQMFGQYI